MKIIKKDLYKNNWDCCEIQYLFSAELDKDEVGKLSIPWYEVDVFFLEHSQSIIFEYADFKARHIYLKNLLTFYPEIHKYINRYLLLL